MKYIVTIQYAGDMLGVGAYCREFEYDNWQKAFHNYHKALAKNINNNNTVTIRKEESENNVARLKALLKAEGALPDKEKENESN